MYGPATKISRLTLGSDQDVSDVGIRIHAILASNPSLNPVEIIVRDFTHGTELLSFAVPAGESVTWEDEGVFFADYGVTVDSVGDSTVSVTFLFAGDIVTR